MSEDCVWGAIPNLALLLEDEAADCVPVRLLHLIPERVGNNLNVFKDLCLQAKTRIWP